tara:strand:- start:907 stop:1098 length:192 start_codon:yes stop_codon:yes gene_type:complete
MIYRIPSLVINMLPDSGHLARRFPALFRNSAAEKRGFEEIGGAFKSEARSGPTTPTGHTEGAP